MKVKQATLEMLNDIIALENLVWRKDAATKESLKKRIEIFPESFCVVYFKKKLIGMAINALLPKNHEVKEYNKAFFPWERVHNPKGKILYLYCSTVHPDFRGRGIWKKMLKFRVKYAKTHTEIEKVWVAGRNKENEYGPNTAKLLQKFGFIKVKDFLFKGKYTHTLLELLPPYKII